MKNLLIKILRLINIPATDETLNFKHIHAYLQSKVRKAQMSSEFKSIFTPIGLNDYLALPTHKQEQIVYRRYILDTHPQAQKCKASGFCPCECTTEDVIFSDIACDQGCFSEMLSPVDWAIFKKDNNFEIDFEIFST